MSLPPSRQIYWGRTYSRVWDGPEYSSAVKRYRRRAAAIDKLCWVASAALLLATAWMVWS